MWMAMSPSRVALPSHLLIDRVADSNRGRVCVCCPFASITPPPLTPWEKRNEKQKQKVSAKLSRAEVIIKLNSYFLFDKSNKKLNFS